MNGKAAITKTTTKTTVPPEAELSSDEETTITETTSF